MKVRIQGAGLQPAQVSEGAESIVIYDDYDNPIVVVHRVVGTTIIYSSAGQPDFDKLLAGLGIGLNSAYKVAKL